MPKSINAYKRKNLLDGPYRPKPFTAASAPTKSAVVEPAKPPPPIVTILPPTSVITTPSMTHELQASKQAPPVAVSLVEATTSIVGAYNGQNKVTEHGVVEHNDSTIGSGKASTARSRTRAPA
jgi:hypothetical protein